MFNSRIFLDAYFYSLVLYFFILRKFQQISHRTIFLNFFILMKKNEYEMKHVHVNNNLQKFVTPI